MERARGKRRTERRGKGGEISRGKMQWTGVKGKLERTLGEGKGGEEAERKSIIIIKN